MRSIFAPLRRLSISAQVAGGFGILLVLLVVTSFISDRSLRDIRSNIAVVETSSAGLDALSTFFDTFSDARRLTNAYLKSLSAAQLVATRSRQADVGRELASLAPIIGDAGKDLGSKVERYKQSFEQLAGTIAGRQKALSALTANGARLSNFGFTIATDLAAHNEAAAPVAQRLDLAIRALQAASYRFTLSSGSGDADIMAVAADRVRDDVALLKRQPPQSPTAAALLEGAAAPIDKLLEAAATLRPSVSTIDAQTTELNDVATEIVDAIVALRTRSHDRHNASVAKARETMDTVLMTGVAAAVLSVTLGIAIAILVGASISRLLSRITGVMSKLAQGDLAVTVPATDRRDEVGRMAQAIQVFKDAAVEKLRLAAETAETRRRNEEERGLREAEKAEEARQDKTAIEGIGDALKRLAGGDLVHRIVTPFAAKTEPLRADFNRSAETLQTMVLTIMANAAAIGAGTGELSTAAGDLSRRTEQQAASLEETSAALDEITATVRQTAAGSDHARTVVGATKADAEQSRQVVRDAIEAMSNIERSSDQIGQIIGVIDEIAFQTNLLALNAGVEAARAGEAGRGFAVVASEVRALAQRSAQAAKEIKALIATSGGHVGRGVELVAQTGQVLERISSKVAEINTIVGEIATSAAEQATALNEVNTAMNQMDQMTQQNAAMVEQSTAATQSLVHETNQLSHLIEQFKAERVGTPPPAARRNEASTTPRAGAKTLKTTGPGGAARAVAAEPEGWEEF